MDTTRFEHAVSLRGAGDIEGALQEFNLLARLEKDAQERGSIILNQAACLILLGRVREARERWFESAACWTNLHTEYMDAILCIEEGKQDAALGKLTDFLKRHDELKQPGNEDTYSEAQERRGYLLFGQKRYTEAIESFAEALIYPETDERNRQLSLYLGICHLETANLEAAERTLARSLPPSCDDPLWTKVQFQLGRLYFQQRAYAKARTAFEICEFSTEGGNIERKHNVSQWLADIATYLPAKGQNTQQTN